VAILFPVCSAKFYPTSQTALVGSRLTTVVQNEQNAKKLFHPGTEPKTFDKHTGKSV